ncbi:MAG TPA: SDR family NAD(P)-dependent oxidoreductase [Desulfomonilia bacterium]|nr:SDR family NAD(P)-dependent oxidoreductase [Desulfomonilia bacterium]
MKNLKDKVVVITGAASGIGLEMARAFAAEGSKLALADINAQGLDTVRKEFGGSGRTIYTQVVDVSKKEQVKDFCDKVYEKMGRVDVLCNNAGIANGGKFDELPLDSWEKIIGVNLWSVIYGCHYFYPRMIEQGDGGHIVNTASGAGLAPLPLMTAYCCTKFAVEGFSETLRAEAALHGIGVTSVCPGIVKTNITVNGMKVYSSSSSGDGFLKKLDNFYAKRNYTPDRVAKKVVNAVKKNTAVLLVCPETYMGDLTHKLSRTFSIYQAKQLAGMFGKHI